MTTMNDRVIECSELSWPFDHQGPRLSAGDRTIFVDPFPCYAHDRELVCQQLAAVERIVNIKHKPTLFNLHFEPLERTNGWATTGYDWDAEGKAKLAPGQI